MVVDAIETYLDLDQLESTTTSNDPEERIETALDEMQSRYNQMREKFVSLKTVTDTLKEKIKNERELWMKELRETIELEKRAHDFGSGDKPCITNDTENMKNYVFNDFFRLSNASKNLEEYVRKHNYQQTLSDVETECNMELLKIQHSMTILKPLKDMAARWVKKEQHEAGDHISCNSTNHIDVLEGTLAKKDENVGEVIVARNGDGLTEDIRVGQAACKENE